MSSIQKIVLAGGCFWCLEAVFQRLQGVEKVVSGYTGGNILNPSYKEVCSGDTGHAEAVEISFDSNIITLKQILEVFWNLHDPTTLNKQGADHGSQYRSAIFYIGEGQKAIALNSKLEIEKSGLYSDPIVTEISELKEYYPAEDYHQNYYNLNSSQGYCNIVITPKIHKLGVMYKEKLKEN